MGRQRRQASEAEANAIASAVRLRIIRMTYAEALTNKELAHRLGRDPATTLHHVRKLVDTGFLEPQPARRGNRGAKEIPYLSTGLSWSLRFQDDDQVREAMLEAFLAEASETPTPELRQTRRVMRLDPDERAEFERRLDALIQEFVDRPHEPDTPRSAIYFAMYPSE